MEICPTRELTGAGQVKCVLLTQGGGRRGEGRGGGERGRGGRHILPGPLFSTTDELNTPSCFALFCLQKTRLSLRPVLRSVVYRRHGCHCVLFCALLFTEDNAIIASCFALFCLQKTRLSLRPVLLSSLLLRGDKLKAASCSDFSCFVHKK